MKIDGQSEIILIHWEVQGEKEEEFAKRMFRYFCAIWLRFEKRIFPVAIFTDDAVWREPVLEQYKMSLLNYPILDYRFQLIKLKDFSVHELIERAPENPMAWAFSVFGNFKKLERPAVTARAVQGIINTVSDKLKRGNLISLIQSHIKLNESEIKEYKKIQSQKKKENKMLIPYRPLNRVSDLLIEDSARRTTISFIDKLLEQNVSWDFIIDVTGFDQEGYEQMRYAIPVDEFVTDEDIINDGYIPYKWWEKQD